MIVFLATSSFTPPPPPPPLVRAVRAPAGADGLLPVVAAVVVVDARAGRAADEE